MRHGYGEKLVENGKLFMTKGGLEEKKLQTLREGAENEEGKCFV